VVLPAPEGENAAAAAAAGLPPAPAGLAPRIRALVALLPEPLQRMKSFREPRGGADCLLQFFGTGEYLWAKGAGVVPWVAGLAGKLDEKSKKKGFLRAVEQARAFHTAAWREARPQYWWDAPPPPPPTPAPKPVPPPRVKKEKKKAAPAGPAPPNDGSYRRPGHWPSDLWVPEPRPFALPVKMQIERRPRFKVVRRNVYRAGTQKPKRLKPADIEKCQCDPAVGCGESCWNFNMSLRCSSLCACKDKCRNKEFDKMPAPKIKKFLTTNGCGWAVKALEPIPANTFVVEYCGEMLDDAACEQRMWEARARGEQNFYMMQVTPNLIIDAREVASVARLINSSCDPNCRADIWTDAATLEKRVGIFTIKDVAAGEEITYDYNFQHFDVMNTAATSFVCRCGAANCRGTLDADPERIKDYGRGVEVMWDDGTFYRGRVVRYNAQNDHHCIRYEDGDVEKIRLESVKHRWLDTGKTGGGGRAAGKRPARGAGRANKGRPAKRAKKKQEGGSRKGAPAGAAPAAAPAAGPAPGASCRPCPPSPVRKEKLDDEQLAMLLHQELNAPSSRARSSWGPPQGVKVERAPFLLPPLETSALAAITKGELREVEGLSLPEAALKVERCIVECDSLIVEADERLAAAKGPAKAGNKENILLPNAPDAHDSGGVPANFAAAL